MKQSEYILSLINIARSKIQSEKVSATLNDCLRIAMLRNDFINQWWIHMEFNSSNDTAFKKNFHESIKHKFSEENYMAIGTANLETWIDERKGDFFDLQNNTINNSKIYALSIIEIENNLESFENSLLNLSSQFNRYTQKSYEAELSDFNSRILLETAIKSCKNIIGRIRTRASNFLTNTEYDLISSSTNSDIFQRTKEHVDTKLAKIAPDVLKKLKSIVIDVDHKESFAQCLVTCRRVLKSFADSIYPARKESIICSDKKARILDEEKYISRIWQFIYENLGSSTSAKLLESQLQDLGNRVDNIYLLTNKGIHAEVSLQEAEQCVIQTYLIIGDVLRIEK